MQIFFINDKKLNLRIFQVNVKKNTINLFNYWLIYITL